MVAYPLLLITVTIDSRVVVMDLMNYIEQLGKLSKYKLQSERTKTI